MESLAQKDRTTGVLTAGELACAIYEGMAHVQNLAEKLARLHSGAGALTFFDMNYLEVKNFYMNIAQQLIDHAKGWEPRQSGGCELKPEELQRLRQLPWHPEIADGIHLIQKTVGKATVYIRNVDVANGSVSIEADPKLAMPFACLEDAQQYIKALKLPKDCGPVLYTLAVESYQPEEGGHTKHTSLCLQKAADDEPIFVLRAKDPSAPAIIKAWVESNKGLQPNEKLSTALELAEEMDEWYIEYIRK